MDVFGKVTYSKYENGSKTVCSQSEVENFLDSVVGAKKKILAGDLVRVQVSDNNPPLDTITGFTPVSAAQKKFKVPHYIGVSLGATVPVFGFGQNPLPDTDLKSFFWSFVT